jgi:hypothetical protein
MNSAVSKQRSNDWRKAYFGFHCKIDYRHPVTRPEIEQDRRINGRHCRKRFYIIQGKQIPTPPPPKCTEFVRISWTAEALEHTLLQLTARSAVGTQFTPAFLAPWHAAVWPELLSSFLLILRSFNINSAPPNGLIKLTQFMQYRRLSVHRSPLRSSSQSSWLQIQRSRVRFPALPDFLRCSGSGTGSTQPREDNW